MYLKRTIRKLSSNTDPFNPSEAEIWASEKVEQTEQGKVFSAQTILTQTLSNGTFKKDTVNVFPATLIPQLVSGMDDDFNPIINEAGLNELFNSFGYEIVQPEPTE